jgi:hypothetical protein
VKNFKKFWVYKIQKICRLAEEELASDEAGYLTELVNPLTPNDL